MQTSLELDLLVVAVAAHGNQAKTRLDLVGRKRRVLEEMEMARLVWLVGNEPGFTVVHGRSKLTFSWVKVRRLCHLPPATCHLCLQLAFV